VTLLAVKVLLAPSFVVGASLAARRFGAQVGGLIGGLPVVAGPILLVYALVHGRVFAAGAAAGTLLGLISLTAFVVVYGRLAERGWRWGACLLAGWLGFCAVTAVFNAFTIPPGFALALSCAGFLAGLTLLPRPLGELTADTRTPTWDLPLRAACAVALVLALTAVAGRLGPQLSGLLAPFPVITSVLATFTHGQHGADELLRLLRGLIVGFGAFALFCFTLAVCLRGLGIAGAFPLAICVAVLVQGLAISRTRRGSVRIAPVSSSG
jgi:hypothetical protein